MAIEITPLGADVGLHITGVSGSGLLAPEVVDEIRRGIDERVVVVIRRAAISDDDLVALSGMLGTVVVRRAGGLPDHPEVEAISLDPAASALADYQRGTFFWHTDGTTSDELPQKITLLTAIETADAGGDTEFANGYAAYEALSDEDKDLCRGLQVVHSFAAAQILADPEPTDRQRAIWERVPPRVHPLVWTRRSGRRSLLIGATAGEVVGWPADESRALLDRLLAWTTQPRFVVHHRWEKGDLVIWDNTGALHRAWPYTATSRRLMHRTTLAGEEAVA